jgi:hypothetical protein
MLMSRMREIHGAADDLVHAGYDLDRNARLFAEAPNSANRAAGTLAIVMRACSPVASHRSPGTATFHQDETP